LTAQSRKPVTDEYDPANIKLAHRTPWNASDTELLFLKQIGLRWIRLEYGSQDPHVDTLRKVQQRFESFGLWGSMAPSPNPTGRSRSSLASLGAMRTSKATAHF
jgi:hypothetical protein